MQKLTLIVIVAFLFSCGNQKSRIVEQIKLYKDSSRMVLDSTVKLTVDGSLKYEELFYTNGKSDYEKLEDTGLKKRYLDYQADEDAKKWDWDQKKLHYQGKIDSLELELKKY